MEKAFDIGKRYDIRHKNLSYGHGVKWMYNVQVERILEHGIGVLKDTNTGRRIYHFIRFQDMVTVKERSL